MIAKVLSRAATVWRREGATSVARKTYAYVRAPVVSWLYTLRYTAIGKPVIPVRTHTPVGSIRLEVDADWWRLGLTAADVFPYEPTLMWQLHEQFGTEDVFYNVGARWGVFSRLAVECGLPPDRIHNFEANAESVELLERNTATDTHVNHAFVGSNDDGGMVSIDSYVDSHDTPTILKIDVEGAEGDVIRGADRTIRTQSPQLFIEMHPQKIRELGDDQHEIVSRLESYDYTVELFLEHRHDDRAVPVADATLPTSGDYLLRAWRP